MNSSGACGGKVLSGKWLRGQDPGSESFNCRDSVHWDVERKMPLSF